METNSVTILILCVIISACAGALGYFLGERYGSVEGFLNGAITILTENDDFLAYNSRLVKRIQQKGAEQPDDSDDDDIYSD